MQQSIDSETELLKYFIHAINKSKSRYNITITPNPYDCVHIVIKNLNSKEVLFNRTFMTTEENYLNFINELRNVCIEYGALVSVLTNAPKKKETTYNSQQIFLKNLEMGIKINNKIEEQEAVLAHARIRVPELNKQIKLSN